MRQPIPQADWPASWKLSRTYDLLEVYGSKADPGYSYAYENRRRHTIDLVRRVAAPGARVLDLAAAQGNFTLTLAELGYDVTWNDLRGELADYVRLKHEHGTVHFAPGNAFELRFDAPFDVVLAMEVIEHVAHPDDFLRKLAGLVRPGGHVLVTTPNGGYVRNPLPRFSDHPDPSVFESMQFKPNADGHIFLLHEDEMRALAAKAGLEVVALRIVTSPLTNGFLRTAPLLRVLPKGLVWAAERATGGLPRPVRRKVCTAMVALLRRPA